MAVIWSLATLGSAVAANYGPDDARPGSSSGVGEAAYGSVGLAVVLTVFAADRRASLTGAFMAGGSFGSVLGVCLGGVLAAHFGWRWSFGAMALVGLVLRGAVPACWSTTRKLARNQHRRQRAGTGTGVRPPQARQAAHAVSTPSVICAYLGSGLQLFIAGSLFAWMPSYLNRAYGLAPDKAGVAAAGFILLMGVGMIVCGMVTDRLTRRPGRSASGPPRSSTPRCPLVLLPLGFAHGARHAAAAS